MAETADADCTIVFSTTTIKAASTPNVSRRIRRSSGPGAPVALSRPPTPATRSNSFNNSTRLKSLPRSASAGRKQFNDPSFGNVTTRGGRNQEKPYEDMKLESGAVLKALNRLTNSGQDLYGVNLRGLVDNPKSCRNLIQQFEDAPYELPKLRASFASGRDESVLPPYASKDSKGKDYAQHDGPDQTDEQRTKLRMLVQKFRQSNRGFVKKYQQSCQADYIAKRDAILKPQLVEKATANLQQLGQAMKSVSGGPTAFKTIHLLREKKEREGIPCPAEHHAHVVETVVNLDNALNNQQKLVQMLAFLSNEKLNEMLMKKTQSMEMGLQRLETVRQERDDLQDRIQHSRDRLNKMLDMQRNAELKKRNADAQASRACVTSGRTSDFVRAHPREREAGVLVPLYRKHNIVISRNH